MAVLENLISSAATLATLFLFASPWRSINQIKQGTTTTNNVQIAPYLAMGINCYLWSFYGVTVQDPAICFVNFVGAALSIYFLGIYYLNSKTKELTRKQIAGMIATVVAIIGYVRLTVLPAELAPTLGMISSTASIIMFGSPLAALVTVMKTKNSESMPLLVSGTATVSSSLWVLYGYLIQDRYVMVPNGVGLLLSLAQVLVIFLYRSPASHQLTASQRGDIEMESSDLDRDDV